MLPCARETAIKGLVYSRYDAEDIVAQMNADSPNSVNQKWRQDGIPVDVIPGSAEVDYTLLADGYYRIIFSANVDDDFLPDDAIIGIHVDVPKPEDEN